MFAFVSTILLQFAADIALGVLAIVRTGIYLRSADLATGLTRRMLAVIRTKGILLEALPAHRLLRAQTQRRQKQEAAG